LREGYDYDAFREFVLEPLSSGGNRQCRLKFWNSQDDVAFPDERVDVDDDAILIVDGVFLQTPLLRSFWDLIVWMDVDWETMLKRAASRDVAWVGSTELVQERYQTGWIPRQKHYERSLRPRESATVVVDNSDIDAPKVRYSEPGPSGTG
jgi:uridine kinase